LILTWRSVEGAELLYASDSWQDEGWLVAIVTAVKDKERDWGYEVCPSENSPFKLDRDPKEIGKSGTTLKATAMSLAETFVENHLVRKDAEEVTADTRAL
jgi:hypothetical protein